MLSATQNTYVNESHLVKIILINFLLTSGYTEQNMPQIFKEKIYNCYLHYSVKKLQLCYSHKMFFLILPIIADDISILVISYTS